MTLSFVISKLCSIYFDPRNQNCMLFDLYLCSKSFLAIKSGRKSYLIFFCDPRPPHCGWSHLLCLSHDHLIKPKAERRIPLLVTKRGSNIIPDMIFYPRPSNCGWFHLLCLTHDHFIKPKAEKYKIMFFGYNKTSKI